MKYFYWMSFFLFFACTKTTYSPEELYSLVRKGDPQMKAVVSHQLNRPLVRCTDYQPNCENAFVVKIKQMEVVFLQYSNVEDAFKAAVKIDGFIIRNWAIDDVAGEPILESFMMKHLGARKAR